MLSAKLFIEHQNAQRIILPDRSLALFSNCLGTTSSHIHRPTKCQLCSAITILIQNKLCCNLVFQQFHFLH